MHGEGPETVGISDVYSLLLDIKGDLGEIRTTASMTAKRLDDHVEDDRRLEASVVKLQLQHASIAGASKVWALVAGAAGTLVGGMIDYFFVHHTR